MDRVVFPETLPQAQPEVTIGALAEASSSHTLDRAITVGVLRVFLPDMSTLGNHVIIGTLCNRQRPTTTKVDDIIYHTLPVLPHKSAYLTEQPSTDNQHQWLNHRATRLLFNIANHGSVQDPEPAAKPTSDPPRARTWLMNNLIFAGGAVVAEFFRHRESGKYERAMDTENKIIRETSDSNMIIIEQSKSGLQSL